MDKLSLSGVACGNETKTQRPQHPRNAFEIVAQEWVAHEAEEERMQWVREDENLRKIFAQLCRRENVQGLGLGPKD